MHVMTFKVDQPLLSLELRFGEKYEGEFFNINTIELDVLYQYNNFISIKIVKILDYLEFPSGELKFWK